MLLKGEFRHNLLPHKKLKRTTTSEGRVYETPDGNFQSVTTFINDISDKTHLKRWRRRVGNKEANRITREATARGNALHKVAERYLGNEEIDLSLLLPSVRERFEQVKPILDKHVSEVRGIEMPIWNKDLELSGTLDTYLKFANFPVIMDFKTSRYKKKPEWMEGYFFQSSLYSYMVSVKYNVQIKYFVVVVINDHDKPQIVIRKTTKYLRKLMNKLDRNPKYEKITNHLRNTLWTEYWSPSS